MSQMAIKAMGPACSKATGSSGSRKPRGALSQPPGPRLPAAAAVSGEAAPVANGRLAAGSGS